MSMKTKTNAVRGKTSVCIYISNEVIHRVREHCERTGMRQCRLVDTALIKELERREKLEDK